jgi:hypothetical protein
MQLAMASLFFNLGLVRKQPTENTHIEIATNTPLSIWRRDRDSNPRCLVSTHAFQACALNHSAISPPERLNVTQSAFYRNVFMAIRELAIVRSQMRQSAGANRAIS